MAKKDILYQILTEQFNETQLKEVGYSTGIDYDTLPGHNKYDKIRELILYAEINDRLDELIASTARKYPKLLDSLHVQSSGHVQFSREQTVDLLMKQSKEQRAKEISRRRFLMLLAGLAGAGGLALFSLYGEDNNEENPSQLFDRFVYGVERETNENQISSEIASLSRNVFGNFQNFSISAGTQHLIKNYGIDRIEFSTNTLGAIALCAVISQSPDSEWLDHSLITSSLPKIESDRDILVVGSPVSDPVSQMILEYEGSGYEMIRKKDALINLPFEYVMHKDLVGFDVAPARRFVAGVERSMPNWRITEDGKFLPPPKLDSRGWIQSDYLLITKLPNFFTRKAFLSGASTLTVGGTHGTGTYAIKNLLNQERLLEQIMHKISDFPYYQILIPITEIEHSLIQTETGKTLLSHAASLGNILVREVTIDSDKILSVI